VPVVTVAFLITSLIIVVTPGIGVLLTISTGLTRGARAGVIAAFGCTLGIVPHLTAAITGTAALLHASGVAFEAMKVAGVVYLLYLAWTTWRDERPLAVEPDRAGRSALRIIGSAILANLLNPKLTIFFFAFLPQFVPRHGHGQLGRMIELSLVFMAMTFVVFALYGLFAASVRDRVIARPRLVRRLRRTFAASFVALGVKLAATARS
jgi:threonine/homoserine/homoserine lactone efflux protein